MNLQQSVRDDVLHEGIDSSPEVDVASSGLRVIRIPLALQHILDQELDFPLKYYKNILIHQE